MLQSTGSQRIRHNLVTEQQHAKSLVLLFILFGLIPRLLAHMGPLTLSGKGLSSHHRGQHSANSWDLGKQGLQFPPRHSTEVRTCPHGELLRLPSGPSRNCDAGVKGQEAELPESGWSSCQPCDSECHVSGCLGAHGKAPPRARGQHHPYVWDRTLQSTRDPFSLCASVLSRLSCV